MTKRDIVTLLAVALLGLPWAVAPAAVRAQESATLVASRDNTLYQDAGGGLSNGVGPGIFAGRTNQGSLRRALLFFDVAAAIPAGMRVESATLQLVVSQANSDAHPMALHRVLAAWGEGGSNAGQVGGSGAAALTGDATWLHTLFDTERWQSPGGDFTPAASATASVGRSGTVTWGSTPEMVADVQAWLDDPASNFGWMLIGAEEVNQSAKRFHSREAAAPLNRPTLVVTFAQTTAREAEPEAPSAVRLARTFPNPFAAATTLEYVLEGAQAVRLDVFDLLGRRVATLVDGVQAPGLHHARFDAATLPEGLYLYRLQAGASRLHGTMVLRR